MGEFFLEKIIFRKKLKFLDSDKACQHYKRDLFSLIDDQENFLLSKNRKQETKKMKFQDPFSKDNLIRYTKTDNEPDVYCCVKMLVITIIGIFF